jgi:hypothetical protein
MYHGPYGTEFYRQLHVVLHKEFRSRRVWRALRSRNGNGHNYGLRDIASMAVNAATLPGARRKLEKLAVKSAHSLGALPQIMTPEAAARPTPQLD